MENELIRRSDVLDKVVIFPTYSANGESVDTYVIFDDDVMSIPTVDAVEVRHGRWIECEDVTLDVYYKCSVCGNEWDIIEGTPEDNNMKYCPECGARMDGEEEHNAAD